MPDKSHSQSSGINAQPTALHPKANHKAVTHFQAASSRNNTLSAHQTNSKIGTPSTAVNKKNPV